MSRTLFSFVTATITGCASFGASNGRFTPESAVGGTDMVDAARRFNTDEAEQEAIKASSRLCEELVRLAVSQQLPPGSVVNCPGVYYGPISGWSGYNPYGGRPGYGQSPSLLWDFQFTEQWQAQVRAEAEAAEEIRRLNAEAAALRTAEGK